MLDFTSSLYLGMSHPSAALGAWGAFTLGRPAALEEPPGAVRLAQSLARLQGLAAAALLPSTLHLFSDLLQLIGRAGRTVVLLDAGAYPILRWAADAGGVRTLHTFAHHDAHALAASAARFARRGLRPIVVTDGYCPACNRPAPLRDYAEISRAHGGWLVLDDTQALGVLGADATADSPLGIGGGGSMRWHGIEGPRIAVGASLAKGFGAPLAVLSGPETLLRRFGRESRTRLHCSPPSVPAIAAAQRALHCAAGWGDALRRRLAALARRLRRLAETGLACVGELPFPLQSFRARSAGDLGALQRRLLERGVRALLTAGCAHAQSQLTFIITARHSENDIDRTAAALAGHALAA